MMFINHSPGGIENSETRLMGVAPIEERDEHLVVSYEAGDGKLPTLQPHWESVEPTVDVASTQFDLESSEGVGPRTAVMIHAYHEEGLRALLGRVRETVWPASFFITTDTSEKACRIRELAVDVLGCGASFQVRLTPNRGRDVLPFWISLKEDAAGYDIFLKLHLKRSAHMESSTVLADGKMPGQYWFEDILNCLIPSSVTSFRAMQSLLEPGRLAALYPKPWGPLAMYGWGEPANLHWVAEILKGYNIHPMNILLPLIYPVGNMFIGSVSSFLPFADFFTEFIATPPEPLPIDGTVLHGIERCYSYLLAGRGENVGVLFPSRPEDLTGEVPYWSFPLTKYFQHSNPPADAALDPAFLSTISKLGLVAIEEHHKNFLEIARLERQNSQRISEIARLENQNSALVDQIQLMSRPLHRRLLSRLVRG
jgi:hypothetical protein